MTENLQLFLDRFHTYVMPSAETESMNLLVASQKNQTRRDRNEHARDHPQVGGTILRILLGCERHLRQTGETRAHTIGTVHQILVRTGTSAVEGFVITLMTPIIGILMETCH